MPTDWIARVKAIAYHRAAKRFFRLQAEQEQHLHPGAAWKDRGKALYRQWEATQPPIPPIDWADEDGGENASNGLARRYA